MLAWNDLAPRIMPIWYPVRSSVYTGHSFPHTWNPDRQLYGILNGHTLMRLESNVRGFAHRKHLHPSLPTLYTGWRIPIGCSLWKAYTIGPMSADQYKQIDIWR
jgi:hypothetical protein